MDREWPRREEHAPDTLLRLASLVAEVEASSNRAWELVKLAVKKGGSDARVMTAALGLKFKLGREGEPETAGWISQALALSSDTGPLLKLDLATVVQEWMPADRERAQTAEDLWRRGDIPVHFAAAQLNAPLSHLLIAIPRANADQQDGRRLTLIPIISGVRQPLPVQPRWAIGLDLTSLLVLAHLGLAGEVIASLPKSFIAPDTLPVLLNERHRVRFHQPARVAAAEELRGLLDRGKLRETQAPVSTPEELAAEVGPALAELLGAARESCGRVVRPGPIYKIGSLMTEPATLGDHDRLICSTLDLEEALFREGILDAGMHERAARYLRTQDSPKLEVSREELLDTPLYLDRLAVEYLQTSGLLPVMAESGRLDLRVHPTLRAQINDLLATSREGDQLAALLEALRVTLRDGIEQGRIELLPRHRSPEEEKWLFETAPTISEFMQDTAGCDAISIDDRYFNKHAALTDRQGRTVPVVCVLDLLRHLEDQGKLQPAQTTAALHRIRQSGFVFLPVSPRELVSHLTSAHWRDDRLVETPELRVLRQSLARLAADDALTQPAERVFAGSRLGASVLVIRELWLDQGLAVERAATLSQWVWQHIAPSPWDFLPDPDPEGAQAAEALAQQVSLLLHPMPPMDDHRHEVYLGWLDAAVLRPLVPANASVIARLAELAGRQIEHMVSDVTEHAAHLARYLFSRLPRRIAAWLVDNFSFKEELGLHYERIISLEGVVSVGAGALFHAARCLLATRTDQQIPTVGGRAMLTLRDGLVVLDVPRERGTVTLGLKQLNVLSPDPEARLQVFDELRGQLGPTCPDLTSMRQAAELGPLSDAETNQLFHSFATAVAPCQARLSERLAAHQWQLDDLVPDSHEYFEQFCGPDPQGTDAETYLTVTLPEVRKELLRRDPAEGLRISLLGALRDDLCPGQWLADLNDDVLWIALQACQPETDPLSLLAALDVALYRQQDQRFAELADKAVAALLSEQFPAPNEIDFYRLFPLLAALALDEITFLENGSRRAPFWRRLCTWMQALLVIRQIPAGAINLDNLDALTGAIEANLSLAGRYARLVDLRQEPMYHPGQLSAQGVRLEVLGRLRRLVLRHQAAGRQVPRADQVEQAPGGFEAGGSHFSWMPPGPLEGHRRPAEVLPEALQAEISTTKAEQLPAALLACSRLYRLTDDLRSRLRASIEVDSSQEPDLTRELSRLEYAGLVAAAERDRELADAVAAAATRLAPCVQEAHAGALLKSLLVAATAIQDERAWADWLKVHCAEVARRLPAGRAANAYWHWLQQLKQVTRLHLGIEHQAEAVASAGMF